MSDSVPEPDPPDREGADFVPEPGSSLDLEPPAPAPLLGAPGTTAELPNPLSLWIVDPDDAPALDPEDGAAVCPGPPLEAEPPEPAPPDPKAPPAPPECGAPSRRPDSSGIWYTVPAGLSALGSVPVPWASAPAGTTAEASRDITAMSDKRIATM